MKKILFVFLFGIFSFYNAFGQQTIVMGSVNDATSNEPIPGVIVTIEGTNLSTTTDGLGVFSFNNNVPFGEQMLNLSKEGYVTNRYPIVVNEGKTVDITDMILEVDVVATTCSSRAPATSSTRRGQRSRGSCLDPKIPLPRQIPHNVMHPSS